MNGVQVWTCRHCGVENLADYRVCQNCGSAWEAPTTYAEGGFRSEQQLPPKQGHAPARHGPAFEQDARPAHGPSEAQRRQKPRKDRRQHGPR